MARRTPETLVDWLVVGIAPFLIMLLVGSLVFYLVEVFYLGEYQLRLLWVLGLFVMAIVCVARISMEEGGAYASLYAVPLAGAVGLALATFVEVRGPLAALGPALNWILMAIIWWSAHKLTWDCTLIEGGRDFTGQGLMQTTGLDRFFRVKLPAKPESTSAESPQPPLPDLSGTSSTTTPQTATLPVWQWWVKRDERPHAPGVWVVYFSLAALPLFGLGQWFMPADDGSSPLRRRAFWLLVVYVAAGLSLLMATSFLSLRRYLRQRKLEMPNEMAGVWLGTGAAMVVILLILASLLPRPSPEYSVTHLAPEIKAPSRTASRWGWGSEGAKPKPGANQTATQGEPGKNGPQSSSQSSNSQSSQSSQEPGNKSGSGQNSGSSSSSGSSGNNQQPNNSGSGNSQQNQSQSSPNQSEQNASGQNQSSSGNQQNEPGQQSQAGKTENQNSNAAGQQNPSQSQSNEPTGQQSNSANEPQPNNSSTSEASAPPPTPPSISQSIGQLFAYLMHALKWMFYLAVAAIIAYFVWKHREQLLVAWQQLLKELRELWEKWFGQKPAPAITAPAPAPQRVKKFADYPDPFASGLAARWSLAELVQYTFSALEARGRERDCPRGEEQTPLEYAAAVGQVEPAFASDFRSLADLYGQLAFAGGNAPPQAKSLVQRLWQRWQTG